MSGFISPRRATVGKSRRVKLKKGSTLDDLCLDESAFELQTELRSPRLMEQPEEEEPDANLRSIKVDNAKLLSQRPPFTDMMFVVDKQDVPAHLFMIMETWPSIFDSREKAAIYAKRKNKKYIHRVELKKLVENMSGVGVFIKPEFMSLLLEFLYTGDIQTTRLSASMLIQLAAQVAHLGKVGETLEKRCMKIIKSGLNLENVFSFLKVAYEVKHEGILQLSCDYVFDHYEEFVARKKEITALGLDTFQFVSVEVQKRQQSGEHVIWNNSFQTSNCTLAHMRNIYESMEYSDGVADLGTVKVVFHKAILASRSEVFHQLFQSSGHSLLSTPDSAGLSCAYEDRGERSPKPGPRQAPKPLLRQESVQQYFFLQEDGSYKVQQLAPTAFRILLKFIYYRDVSELDIDSAVELIPFCRSFLLTDLQRECEKMTHSELNTTNAPAVLLANYLPGTLASREQRSRRIKQCLNFIAKNEAAVSLDAILNVEPSLRHVIACRILFAIQARYNGNLACAAESNVDYDGFWKTSASRPAPGSTPTSEEKKSGFLYKKGAVRRNWTKRWFILKVGWISYYEKPKSVGYLVLKGEFPLTKHCKISPAPEMKRPYSFLIHRADDRKFYMAAPTQSEMDEWLRILPSCCVDAPIAAGRKE